MKRILFIVSIFFVQSAAAQLTLKQCVDSALANRGNIKAARTEQVLAGVKRLESESRYRPQLSLAYDYRYNPIIAKQIVPVGMFGPNPTSETMAIAFGTPWQQNAGLTLYQPLLDAAVKSRIRESRLQESLSGLDLKKAETELQFEIVKTYSRILSFDYQAKATAADTLRSYYTVTLFANRYKEGKVLKTELNTAMVNHQANLIQYGKDLSGLLTEKIYLHYLTNIPLEKILSENLQPLPASLLAAAKSDTEIKADSLVEYQSLQTQEQILKQQLKTAEARNKPTIGFEGFLGANQFSPTFNPVRSNTWFGTSYVGVSVKLPILSSDKVYKGGQQLQYQLESLSYKKAELLSDTERKYLQLNAEIQRLQAEIAATRYSNELIRENIRLFQERLESGLVASLDLNEQEASLQKRDNDLKQLTETLNAALLERVYISGMLETRLREL